MNFDDFIQCCVMIRMLTDAFRKKDAQQRGMIQIHYEEVISLWCMCYGCPDMPMYCMQVRVV